MTAFTMKSPTTGGDLPSGVTAVGGVVLDLIGLNGVRIVLQLPANQLFSGMWGPDNTTPAPNGALGRIGQIGVVGGLSPQVLAQLGGGLSQMAVRITVDDADTSVGDLDYMNNFLTLNGRDIGNLSTQATQSTSNDGVLRGSATGFQNGSISTGWFLVTDSGVLNDVYGSFFNGNQAAFGIRDEDADENGYNFKVGIDGSYFGVTTPNQAPTAVDDNGYVVSHNGRLTVAATNGVLANDTDPENANLTAVVVQGPQHGAVTLNADGSFTYIPNQGYSGPDSFTYRTSDGALVDDAVVSLTVSANVAPVARADAYSMERGAVLTVDAVDGVLANDNDPEGGTLTASLFNGPQHGTVTLTPDGAFVYTPNPRFHGTDSFIYLVTDSSGEISTQVVTLTVVNNNTPPVAVGESYEVDRNTVLTVTAEDGVLANDHDPDGDTLQILLAGPPLHGSITINQDGSFTYTPHLNYSGPDSFSYLIRDPSGDESLATVNLTVRGPNNPPVARDNGYQVDEDGTLTIGAPGGVLANDIDPEGAPLTAQLVSGPSHGTLELAADGSFIYIPNPGFTGTDSFVYAAFDGRDSTPATVTLTVNSRNDAPVGVADSYAVQVGDTLNVNAADGVLANDSDEDGDDLTATLLQGPRNGQFSLNADGSFTYTPDAGFTGTDTFTYSLNDGTTSVPVTVTLTVNPRPGRVVTLDDNDNRVTFARDGEAVIVHALGGNDSITGTRFDDELLLGDGNDEGIGGDGADVIRGGIGNDKMFGQGGSDRLEGGEGDDLMHGGDGADVMVGGIGNDIYYVHSADDQVVEVEGEGRDNVRSTVSWVLGDHFEELMLEGMANIDGTGNALDNAVLGNNANNTLYGLDGNDTLGGYGGDDILFGGRGNDRLVGREGVNQLFGGEGDDQYFVGSQDTIEELDGEGFDVVFSVGDFVLSDNLEVLRLDGTANLRGEGNDGDNYIAGTSGNNILIGRGGDDQIFGGQGDDHLVGDSSGDGAWGNDRLDGGEGSDWLNGGLGDDTLWGGGGNDSFHFAREHLSDGGEGWDTIFDFQGAGTTGEGDQDLLEFSGFSGSASLVFERYGASQSHQFYRIVDPENPGATRLILVKMVGTTNHLTSDDYVFNAA
ncbi:MAG: tandem-95 repeat protein [Brevundimonas sp.]|nr:tandem-95 repeat protein [Brevundimonas sp.]